MIKKYCIVGTGQRAIGMYGIDLVKKYTDHARLTGLCDINPGRLEWAKQRLGVDVPVFTDFDEMLDSIECDTVIVATVDSLHDEFIIKAMRRGKDVITEKPMTTDSEKCRAIFEVEQETGRQLQVTFNARYTPYTEKIKELLAGGIIGEIHSVEFHWFLDTVHGADYFRRWHRKKENSGGLLVHKATHHFDLMNWWLDMEPQEVAAFGSRHYYVPERKPGHGERCLTCQITDECEFFLDITKDTKMNAAYLQNEKHDGYHRDQCVFSDEIDIEDTMSLLVRYSNRVQMTYSLTAATSFEGYQVAFNGSLGRLEAFQPSSFVPERDQTSLADRTEKKRTLDWRTATQGDTEEQMSSEIRFYPLFGGVESFTVPRIKGGHGGGDARLKDHLFLPDQPDPYKQRAGSRAGAMSLLIGVAANESIKDGQFVSIAELIGEKK